MDVLTAPYKALRFDAVTGDDDVFAALVLARIIERTSKLDSRRVADEAEVEPPSYRPNCRHLPVHPPLCNQLG
jgi:hypothetical protein